ncbi:DUF1217 domain-containing protein [Consotaella aegiceratis]|uniref:DUF1217 domain-containing protein n=1 Tax=Consotaella aegiceratis TaxID=3097961 RepID=UPI002F4063DE
MLTASLNYQIISRNLEKTLENTSQKPAVETATEKFRASLSSIKTVDDFMASDEVYQYAVKAYGLEDMAYAKAYIRKVVSEGVTDSDSFANKLTDSRYKALASAFTFDEDGNATFDASTLEQTVVDKYTRQTLEEDAGDQNEGTRLALYFQRKAEAGEITSAYSILADEALLEVAQTALGFDSSTGSIDIDKLADMYGDRIDIEDLQDPEELDKFLKQFLAMYDMENDSSSTAASNPAVQVLTGSATTLGLDSSLLLTLQTLRSKG